MEFAVTLIKAPADQHPEAMEELRTNCTEVGNGYWIYEGDLEELHAEFIPLAEGIAGPLGDLSKEQLMTLCWEEFNVDVSFLGIRTLADKVSNMDFPPPSGIARIAGERASQLARTYDAKHDAEHTKNELAFAAVYFALPDDLTEVRSANGMVRLPVHDAAFFGRTGWHPSFATKARKSRVHQLEVAGALLAAEIDRLQAEYLATIGNVEWLDALKTKHKEELKSLGLKQWEPEHWLYPVW